MNFEQEIKLIQAVIADKYFTLSCWCPTVLVYHYSLANVLQALQTCVTRHLIVKYLTPRNSMSDIQLLQTCVTRHLVILNRWWFGTSDVVVYLSACEFVGNLQVQTSCLTCQCWWRSFSWLYQSPMWVSQNVSQAQLQVCHSPCTVCYVEYPHPRVGYQCHWSHRYVVHAYIVPSTCKST